MRSQNKDFYRNDNEIPEYEDSSDSSDSSEDEEMEESQEEESEENDADQHQIDFLLKDQMNEEDKASVTVIGNNRRQERVEKTIVQNAQTIYQIKLRHRIDVSIEDNDSESEREDQANLMRKPSDNLYDLPRIANHRHSISKANIVDEGIHHLKRVYFGEKFQMHNIVEVGAASHKRFHKIVDYGRIQFRENPFKFGVRAKKSQDEPTMCGDYISKECIKRCYMTTAKQKKLLDEDSTNHGLIWSL